MLAIARRDVQVGLHTKKINDSLLMMYKCANVIVRGTNNRHAREIYDADASIEAISSDLADVLHLDDAHGA